MRFTSFVFVCFQSYIERGLFAFTYGQDDSIVDFVHVNNLVQAHILAGKTLMEADSIAVSKEYINYVTTELLMSKNQELKFKDNFGGMFFIQLIS